MSRLADSQHELLHLLQLGDIDLQILVPLELVLHGHDILRVPDLPLVGLFEVLLELIKLGPETLPLVLDIGESPGDVVVGSESVLLDDGVSFARRQVHVHNLVSVRPQASSLAAWRLAARA